SCSRGWALRKSSSSSAYASFAVTVSWATIGCRASEVCSVHAWLSHQRSWGSPSGSGYHPAGTWPSSSAMRYLPHRVPQKAAFGSLPPDRTTRSSSDMIWAQPRPPIGRHLPPSLGTRRSARRVRQTRGMPSHALPDRLPRPWDPDAFLGVFDAWARERGLALYPAQEEAVLELVLDRHLV